jgi:TRAP-type C4-dicarboxylate transport system permease small subunit
MPIMNFMKLPNRFIAGLMSWVSSISLVILCAIVLYGVIMRYVFDNASDFVAPIALLMVLVIAFFGAALRVRDGGHIGLDSLVERLPPKGKLAVEAFQQLCLIVFALSALAGCIEMAHITMGDTIPIIGLSEGIRYIIPAVSFVCIVLFCLEHLLVMFFHKQD